MSTSSYVLARDIGCSHQENPWAYLDQGVDVMFTHPQSIATTNGKHGDTSAGSITEVMMGFFSDQVRLGGWGDTQTSYYHSLPAQTYPNVFLPCHYASTCYVNNSSRVDNYNLGQIYLNNSMAWCFMKFPKESIAYELINPHEPTSVMAPVFTDKRVAATGIMNTDAFTDPESSPKFYKMIQLALQEAYSAVDFKGPCGSVLTFICNILDRTHPGWDTKKTITGEWWGIYKQRMR